MVTRAARITKIFPNLPHEFLLFPANERKKQKQQKTFNCVLDSRQVGTFEIVKPNKMTERQCKAQHSQS